MFIILVRADVVSSAMSRKLIHVTTAPLFVLTLPLYSTSPSARVYAAAVPLLFAVRLALTGTGLTPRDPLGSAVSRVKTSASQEAMKGPLAYSATMACLVLYGWRTSPAVVIAMCNLAFGDGAAEIGKLYPVRLSAETCISVSLLHLPSHKHLLTIPISLSHDCRCIGPTDDRSVRGRSRRNGSAKASAGVWRSSSPQLLGRRCTRVCLRRQVPLTRHPSSYASALPSYVQLLRSSP
jgi:hypothetical protein